MKSELQAQKEWNRKQPLFDKIKRFLGEHIKEIPEWVAIAGMTILVKQVIEASEPLQAKAAEGAVKLAGASADITKLAFEFQAIPSLVSSLGITVTETSELQKAILEALDSPQAEMLQWLLAFTIAYILVKHMGQIIGLLGDVVGGLTKIVPLLMGV